MHKTSGRALLIVILLLVVIPLVVLAVWRLEGHAPTIPNLPAEMVIGAVPRAIVVDIQERGRGLKTVRAEVTQAGREAVLEEARFDGSLLGAGSGIQAHTLTLEVDADKFNLSEGQATLRITARDFSWRDWWNGNRTVVEIPLTVDVKPPSITVLSRFHYVNQGGSGLVVYRLNEACPQHGVMVGERFFPGYPAGKDDRLGMMAFFAVGHDQKADTIIKARAVDQAGNEATTGFPYRIRAKRFRKDVLNISERFIAQTMRPLLEAAGGTATEPQAVFLAVNREMRQRNYETLTRLSEKATPEIAWEGVFMRLPQAANRAQFADHRDYKFRGKIIDRQVHLGADLASLQQSPVPAANGGTVVFAGDVGIYGNTVVIEHGFGLFSLYSHLSSIQANTGDRVAKGDIIGRTGITGLAAGDHLHFGMMVHDTLVNPIEWWDAHWIKDNITTKMKLIR
ncbi:MAG: M23 family metallopeptidase [Desulfobacterales bacterium]|jgi:murein DD-endopeptidase MepM/ murein hydrolase activator NlpD